MSLDFDLRKIENHMKVCWIPIAEAGDTPRMFLDVIESDGEEFFLNPKTRAIIWRTMPVGIGVINERTIPEFWARNVVWLTLNNLDEDFTLDDLRQHSGLATNVFPEESRTKWVKRIIGGHLDDLKRQVNYDIKKKVKELKI